MPGPNKAPTKAHKIFRKNMIRQVETLQRSKGITREVFTGAYNEMILFFCGHLLNTTNLNETAISGLNDKGDSLIVTIVKKDLRH